MMLRMSMLPGYNDCARRGAARQFREQITDRGFTLRTTQPSAGARLGDALHRVAADLLRSRADENIISSQRIQDAIEASWEIFKLKIRDGVEWDETTKNSYDAQKQLKGMSYSIVGACQRMMPSQIEYALLGTLASGLLVSGHLDVRESTGIIWDFKTGKRKPTAWSQLGGYAILGDANQLPASEVGMIFCPRVPASKEQPDIIVERLDAEEAKSAARSVIFSIEKQLEMFLTTGNPWSFPANPMSLMCSATYCPAHGTPFCKVGKK